MSTKQLGYRCLAVNISDLAAMGAVPRFYLVSVVIPPHWEELDVLSVFDGLSQLAKKHQMDLIGRDTVPGDTLVLSVAVVGYADEEKVRYRSDATVDDIVFVTGTLGDAVIALDILLNDLKINNQSYFINRHQVPAP